MLPKLPIIYVNYICSNLVHLFAFFTFWTAVYHLSHPISSFPTRFLHHPHLLLQYKSPPQHLLLTTIKIQVGFLKGKNPTSISSSSPALMATYPYTNHQTSSQRSVAMVLALVSAIVLSPLYHVTTRKADTRYYETKWMSSGFVLPMVLAGLIIAIKTTSSSSSSSSSTQEGSSFIPSPDPSWVLRIGSSSWGLAGVLVMLMLVLSWQSSVHEFFWR